MKKILTTSFIFGFILFFLPQSQGQDLNSSDSIPEDGILVDSVTLRVTNESIPNVPDSSTGWDAEEMEAFFDGLFTGHLKGNHIAGATISIVKDGKIFFTKGYGYANASTREPVDPEKTLFYIGSVSKLFTWTALMQLEEKGEVNLEEDISKYIRAFPIPDTYEDPITARHLLTHTPGFEEVTRIFAHNAEDVIPLEDFMKNRRPDRVLPPGQFAAYSNYGAAMGGYLVSEISGETFDDYVEKNIFAPLNMKNSTFRQPQPEDLRSQLSQGYSYENGKFVFGDPEFIHPGPAGVMVSSATDMANFMIAHLQKGKFDSAQILQPATAARMHKRQFWHDPKVMGVCFGFYEMNQRGHRIIGHGGDTRFFHSQLALIPEQETGIFFSFNSENGPEARKPIMDAFMRRYFPDQSTKPTINQSEVQDADQYTGYFRSNRMVYSTYEKIIGLFNVLEISTNDKGQIEIGKFGEESSTLAQISTKTFIDEAENDKYTFKLDEDGDATHLFINEAPILAFEKISWYESPSLHLNLLTISLVLFLSMIILWPVSMYVHRIRRISGGTIRPASQRTALLIGRLASLGHILFTLGVAFVFREPMEALFYGPSPIFNFVLLVPWVAGILSLISLVLGFIAISKKYWNWWTRLQYILAAFAGVIFIVQLNYFNLLTWSF